MPALPGVSTAVRIHPLLEMRRKSSRAGGITQDMSRSVTRALLFGQFKSMAVLKSTPLIR